MENQEDYILFAKGKYDNNHYFFHYTSMDVLCCILNNYRKDLSKTDLLFWAIWLFLYFFNLEQIDVIAL